MRVFYLGAHNCVLLLLFIGYWYWPESFQSFLDAENYSFGHAVFFSSLYFVLCVTMTSKVVVLNIHISP